MLTKLLKIFAIDEEEQHEINAISACVESYEQNTEDLIELEHRLGPLSDNGFDYFIDWLESYIKYGLSLERFGAFVLIPIFRMQPDQIEALRTALPLYKCHNIQQKNTLIIKQFFQGLSLSSISFFLDGLVDHLHFGVNNQNRFFSTSALSYSAISMMHSINCSDRKSNRIMQLFKIIELKDRVITLQEGLQLEINRNQ